jgi:acyl carrier protein
VITIDEVRTRVERELRGKLPAGVAINEATVIKDLGLSSLQISEIVFGLEEDYEVEFDAAMAADAETLGDLLVVANQAIGEMDGSQSAGQPIDDRDVASSDSADRRPEDSVRESISGARSGQ